jgi:LmbE family N-acetylglucosaminyl deacetylase
VKLFLSPHNDDEALFGAFTIQREKPLVVVVFDSYVQENRGNKVTAKDRRRETVAALECLGLRAFEGTGPYEYPWMFKRLRDDQSYESAVIASALQATGFPEVERVFAPAIEENGHEQHNAVGRAADLVWPGRVTHYLTYTTKGKSTSAYRVLVESGDWLKRKLRALACYESQIDIERLNCREHFMRDLWEYYE